MQILSNIDKIFHPFLFRQANIIIFNLFPNFRQLRGVLKLKNLINKNQMFFKKKKSYVERIEGHFKVRLTTRKIVKMNGMAKFHRI